VSRAGAATADARFMDIALHLGARGLGAVWPNPAVGCVLVRDDMIVGRGWTQPGGRPHAETEALLRAGTMARGATAYVTLEPCAHHGRTAPCADALVTAGVARVVAAIDDPDPRVSGRGFARLEAAGITVETGLRAAEATALQAGFLKRIRVGRPLVTLKMATSLDGRIAVRNGDSRWITGEAARARGHLLRARHDAVLIGRGTALADDPDLTCRLPGLEAASPVRVVADRRLRLPPDSRLARTAKCGPPVWLLTGAGADTACAAALEGAGVALLPVAERDGALDPEAALAALATRGITRVLVEGGAQLSGALLRAGLVDRVCWFRAPMVIGDDGLGALAALGLDRVADAPRLHHLSVDTVGDDVLETYAIGA
jgi:diaminohydroxyphosphoribosylaminopyrimidine deaminase/5-amino-6-(5-phosphoribosylamino)uracil reductase